jgi:hypothetical protein
MLNELEVSPDDSDHQKISGYITRFQDLLEKDGSSALGFLKASAQKSCFNLLANELTVVSESVKSARTHLRQHSEILVRQQVSRGIYTSIEVLPNPSRCEHQPALMKPVQVYKNNHDAHFDAYAQTT